MKVLLLFLLLVSFPSQGASTLEAKKMGEKQVRSIVEPILSQYCQEQCKIIHVETEVDIAVQDEAVPGFEEGSGKTTLSPASSKLKILMDENLGSKTRTKLVNLIREHLEELNFPVTVETKLTKFPQPASAEYKIADLRARVYREVKASLQNTLSQFCPQSCMLGEFDLQSEVVNPEEVDYSSSQEFFQDGPAAIRVKNVKATLLVDRDLSPEEGAGVLEMLRAKLAPFKNAEVNGQAMSFPKLAENGVEGAFGNGSGKGTNGGISKIKNDMKTSENKTDKFTALNENKDARVENRQDKFERFERIERVENGDAVQQTLEKFRVYALFFAAIILALLVTLVVIGFRKQIFSEGKFFPNFQKADSKNLSSEKTTPEGSALNTDEKAALFAKRIEADRLFEELNQIFCEQPKVAKHVFTIILTEEGVETTAQCIEIFGETIVMGLLRDPALQGDLSELMDFYAGNTFELNDDERLQLLKKLNHRTVTSKLQVHGSRSAILFDFLADMDSPQILEMIKNESNTVKAIVLTQCDQKKRQALFQSHDDGSRLKLMTELSRIDHLPKNYIHSVASALRRKKAENPKLNTEALPGTDVLVTFLEKADIDTQRTIIQQLTGTTGSETLHLLKTKLASLDTLRFMKDQHLTEIISQIKHDEVVQFLKACSVLIREGILQKIPQDLAGDLREELALAAPTSRETYIAIERKVLNRIKIMANNGQINLAEVNEQMFAQEFGSQPQQSLKEVG